MTLIHLCLGTDVVLTGVDPGSNKVQMRSVDCCGNETSLFQCNSVLEAKTGCTNNRVGIRCTNATGIICYRLGISLCNWLVQLFIQSIVYIT